MIQDDREYEKTVERIRDFEMQADAMRQRLVQDGFPECDVDTALAGTLVILDELRFDRDFYDRLRAEGPTAVPEYPPGERGKALVALRIARRMTQRQLADTLGVSEALVSRDERNDYHGVTLERYARVLGALGIEERGVRYFEREGVAQPIGVGGDGGSASLASESGVVMKVGER